MRALIGRPVALSHTFYAADEETPVAHASVAVVVKDASGATVYSHSATAGDDNSWTVTVPSQARGCYSVLWTADDASNDTTDLEFVGSFIFTVPEARELDSDLDDSGRFPAETIQRHRETVETEFERITQRSFTPRTRVVVEDCDGSNTIAVDLYDVAAVTAVSIDGEAQDLDGWGITPEGLVSAPTDLLEGSTAVLTLDYGFRQVPEDVKRVAVIRLRSLLAAEANAIPARATHITTTEAGTFTLATPGQGRWKTGIPDVDSTLSGYCYDVLGSVS